jgi:hypothetical protein
MVKGLCFVDGGKILLYFVQMTKENSNSMPKETLLLSCNDELAKLCWSRGKDSVVAFWVSIVRPAKLRKILFPKMSYGSFVFVQNVRVHTHDLLFFSLAQDRRGPQF